MKKSTLNPVYAILTNQTVNDADRADAVAEIEAEVRKNAEKAEANRNLYSTAHDVVMAHLSDTPRTSADLFVECESELPEGFSLSKLRYALRVYWSDEVVTHSDTPVNTFTAK